MSANPRSTFAVGATLRHTRKRLCSRLRRLAEASDAHFVAGWPALVAEVESGFRQEESVLEALDDRELRPSRADNACVLRALHRVTPQVESGETLLGREALAALADILSLHRFADGMASRQAGLPGQGVRPLRCRPCPAPHAKSDALRGPCTRLHPSRD
jgi:hypothetical protein